MPLVCALRDGALAQEIAMGNVRSYLDKMISKELTRSGVFHTLLRAYLEHARIAQVCVRKRNGADFLFKIFACMCEMHVVAKRTDKITHKHKIFS